MSKSATFMEFPCDFPLKIIGIYSTEFVEKVTVAILNHFPNTPLTNIVSKLSENGNYIAITATIYAIDQVTLDALYYELGKISGIKMVL